MDNLPNSLTYLTIGANFNQIVDNLQNDLEELIFGLMFKQDAYNLPLNIKL